MTVFLRFGDRLVNLAAIQAVRLNEPVTFGGVHDPSGVHLEIADEVSIRLRGPAAASARLYFEGVGDFPSHSRHDLLRVIDLTPPDGEEAAPCS